MQNRMCANSRQIGYTFWPGDFNLVDPGEFLDEAEALGVDLVEIPFFAARLIANGAILKPSLKIFRERMAGRELAFSTHALLGINLMDVAARLPAHEAVARACIELTAELGASHMVLHCGLTGEQGTAAQEAAYGRQRDALARLGDVAAGHGVVICVETVWNFDDRETALPSRLAAELRAIGHDAVCATLDYAHSALQCDIKGADLMDEIAEIAPLAHHLHLNDCFGRYPDIALALPGEALAYGTGDLHLPLGWGSLAWDRMLTEPAYPDDCVLIDELHPSYWRALGDDVAEMRRLSALMARSSATV